MVNGQWSKVLAGITLVFLLTAGIANAQGVIENIGLSAISTIISWVLYTVGYIASLGVTVGGTLVNWALNLNSHILTDNLVQTGWVVSRDIANLGFVFAIILIAFATILQMQSYAMKQVLLRLIAAALIVNFSLVIAGVFIDFSGILTDFFLSRATNGNISLAGEGLVNAIGVHRVFQQNESESVVKNKVTGIAADMNNFVNFIASLAFAVFFTIATATALFSFAAMFFIRYLSLITLLILAPLAWLMWVWPDTKGQWSKWWSEFFKWIWFGPAASFFFYLALSLALTFNKGGANFLEGETLGAITNLDNTGLLIQNMGRMITQMVSVIGLMYYGLTVANSMGIAGANFGFAVAGKVKGAMLGATTATGGVAGWAGAKGLRSFMAGGIDPATGQNRGQRWGSALMNAPLKGIRDYGMAIRETSTAALRGGTSKDVASYKQRIEDAGYTEYNDIVKNDMASARTDTEKAAWAQVIVEKGWDDKVDKPRLTEFLSKAQNIGGKEFKEIMQGRPDLATHISKPGQTEERAIGDAVEKITDITKIAASALENAIVAINISTEQLLKKGTTKQLRSYAIGLESYSESIKSIQDPMEKARAEKALKERYSAAYQNVRFAPLIPPIMKKTLQEEKEKEENMSSDQKRMGGRKIGFKP